MMRELVSTHVPCAIGGAGIGPPSLSLVISFSAQGMLSHNNWQQLMTKNRSGLARERLRAMKAPHLFPGKSAILSLEMTPEIGP